MVSFGRQNIFLAPSKNLKFQPLAKICREQMRAIDFIIFGTWVKTTYIRGPLLPSCKLLQRERAVKSSVLLSLQEWQENRFVHQSSSHDESSRTLGGLQLSSGSVTLCSMGVTNLNQSGLNTYLVKYRRKKESPETDEARV